MSSVCPAFCSTRSLTQSLQEWALAALVKLKPSWSGHCPVVETRRDNLIYVPKASSLLSLRKSGRKGWVGGWVEDNASTAHGGWAGPQELPRDLEWSECAQICRSKRLVIYWSEDGQVHRCNRWVIEWSEGGQVLWSSRLEKYTRIAAWTLNGQKIDKCT